MKVKTQLKKLFSRDGNTSDQLYKGNDKSNDKIACTYCTVCYKKSTDTCTLRTVVPVPTPTPVVVPTPTPVVVSTTSKIPYASLPGGMTLVQCDAIMSLVSIAENDTIKWYNNYNYCENIKDGRGMTVSLPGFCSGTSDLLWVFQDLQKINANHALLKYLPALVKVNNTSSTTGLENLAADIKTYGDTDWQKAVWDGILHFYWQPAMDFAASINAVSPITKGFLYDLALNHGAEQIAKMAKRVLVATPKNGGAETLWLSGLIAIRQIVITKEDKSTNDGQPDRCIMWNSILTAGNTSLSRPINNLVCYGDKFTIV